MAIKLRKLFESFVTRPAAKEEDSAADRALDEMVVEAEDVRVTELTSLEEMVNEKTKDLEDAREQLKQLASTAYSPEPPKNDAAVKDALAQLLKPEGGLPLKTVKVSAAVEEEVQIKDASASPRPEIELSVQRLKVSPEGREEVEVDAAAQLRPAEPKPMPEVKEAIVLGKKSQAEEKAQNKSEAAEMISKIFNREDESDNPLAGLIASLPEVTIRELLDEAMEIKAMLEIWPKSGR